MRTRRVISLALIVLAAMLASTATAVGSTPTASTPKGSPFQCAGHTMTMSSAKRSVLIKLEYYVNDKPVNDVAFKVDWWRGSWHRSVGYAHPGCWTALAILPSALHYHDGRHPSVLCISTHNGNKPYSDNPNEIAGCPWPKKIRYGGITWTTITFRVVGPHYGG